MRKLLVSIIALCLTAQSLQAALTFGATTSDRVDHGSAANLDNLTAYTEALWINPSVLTSNRAIISKDNGVGGGTSFSVSGTTGNIQFRIKWTGVVASAISSNTPIATTGKWYFIVGTYNAATVPMTHIYVGDQTTSLAEVTYGTHTDGTVAQADDSAFSLIVGNDGTTLAFRGDIALAMVFNTALTITVADGLRFRPYPASGNLLFTHYGGIMGTGTQPDWSGNGNTGAVTGATSSAHPFAYCPYCQTGGRLGSTFLNLEGF